jgi:hypothetical protein
MHAVERGGQIRRSTIAGVNSFTLKAAIREEVDTRARIMSDENNASTPIMKRSVTAQKGTFAAMFTRTQPKAAMLW